MCTHQRSRQQRIPLHAPYQAGPRALNLQPSTTPQKAHLPPAAASARSQRLATMAFSMTGCAAPTAAHGASAGPLRPARSLPKPSPTPAPLAAQVALSSCAEGAAPRQPIRRCVTGSTPCQARARGLVRVGSVQVETQQQTTHDGLVGQMGVKPYGHPYMALARTRARLRQAHGGVVMKCSHRWVFGEL